MQVSISQLSSNDLDSLNLLMMKNTKTLGFLPFQALQDFLRNGTVLGATTVQDGTLVGYLLYAKDASRIRIVQLCVSDNFRGLNIATRLFEALKSISTTQRVISLTCRRDFPAHDLWPKLEFIPVEDVVGRSAAGHLLTRWEHKLAEESQLDLFREKTSNEAIDVAIDAQILFHFNEASSPESDPSKALLADFLTDLIDIWVTDEIFLEIDRQRDPTLREASRQHAYRFRTLSHNNELAQHYKRLLTDILPSDTPSQRSDINHLAKTAASDVRIFLTRDDGILHLSDEITAATQIRVISPAQLVVELYQSINSSSYQPNPISGQDLTWRKLVPDEIDRLLAYFLETNERKGSLRERLFRFVARPDIYDSEILCSQDSNCAIRVTSGDSDTLTVHLARLARSADRFLFGRFLVADSIATAVDRGMRLVHVEANLLPNELKVRLFETGFVNDGDGYSRICLCRSLSRNEVLNEISQILPTALSQYQEMSIDEFENRCSPAHITDTGDSYFIIPIKPGYATSLFDRQEASRDLFGGKSSVLMQWENIYYRKKSHHKVLVPPGRILWYESGERGEITAVSRLNSVEVSHPKDLFRKYKRFGALEWKDLYTMCDKNPQTEIMALRFSHTFSFRCPVTLAKLREIEGRQNVPLQSPRLIDSDEFRSIFEAGFAGVEA